MNRSPADPALWSRVNEIIATTNLPALGPALRTGVKSPEELRAQLDPLFTRSNLTPVTCDLIRAAALLWHDHLDAAHGIVQDASSTEAAFLHGILHRREPDYSNAKYWFQRVGRHATFVRIASQVGALLAVRPSPTATRLVSQGAWQPMRFIESCEEAAGRGDAASETQTLHQIQRIEFETLLEHICQPGKRL